MYARRIGKRTLTFGVSGMLWHQSLVMYDRETDSLWSHLLGRAMAGPLRGTQLERIPAVMTSWRVWKRLHPSTTVLALPRTARQYVTRFHRQPATFVLGVVWKGRSRAYPFDVLAQRRVVNDQIGDEPLVVTFDPESTTAQMFRRTVDERTLTFQRAEGARMTDAETGSTWNALLGICEQGPLKGKELEAVAAVVSYRRAWFIFHPESDLSRE